MKTVESFRLGKYTEQDCEQSEIMCPLCEIFNGNS